MTATDLVSGYTTYTTPEELAYDAGSGGVEPNSTTIACSFTGGVTVTVVSMVTVAQC